MNTDVQKCRTVLYTLKDGQTRPAIVVRVWAEEPHPPAYPPGVVNLSVLVDGMNDANGHSDTGILPEEGKAGVAHRTSVYPSTSGNPEPGRWHWPVSKPIAAIPA